MISGLKAGGERDSRANFSVAHLHVNCVYSGFIRWLPYAQETRKNSAAIQGFGDISACWTNKYISVWAWYGLWIALICMVHRLNCKSAFLFFIKRKYLFLIWYFWHFLLTERERERNNEGKKLETGNDASQTQTQISHMSTTAQEHMCWPLSHGSHLCTFVTFFVQVTWIHHQTVNLRINTSWRENVLFL